MHQLRRFAQPYKVTAHNVATFESPGLDAHTRERSDVIASILHRIA